MYDLPEARAATDAWWRGIARWLARAGIDAPDALTRDGHGEALWRAPDLLLSQTCGWPLVHRHAGELSPLATPAYRVPGCRGARYASLVVVREDDPASALDDLRGADLLVNAEHSWSGWQALVREVRERVPRPLEFFGTRRASGTHRASLAGVQAGRGRYCSVDTVTFHLLARHAPAAVAGLRVLARTRRAPALPYVVTARMAGAQRARMREALWQAAADPALAGCREALFIGGFRRLPLSLYRRHMSRFDRPESPA